MIPPDYADMSQESPREALGNIVMQIRGAEQSLREDGVRVARAVLRMWASRLERAVRQLDAEKAPPELSDLENWLRGGRFVFVDSETHKNYGYRASAEILASFARSLQRGAVSPTAPPAEQDTPHPSLPAPEDTPQ